MRSKKFLLIGIIFCVAILSLSLTSASFFDWITGKGLSERSTTLSIVVSSIVVDSVSAIPAQNVTESGLTNITFYFTASIPGGAVADINDSSARANFTKATEDTRENLTCALVGDIDADTANYSCTIGMWYWDGTGSWTVTAAIADNNGNHAQNDTTTFTLNEWTCFVVSPAALTWPGVTPGATNRTSNNDPSALNNTCNKDTTVQVKAIDLQGESTPTDYIVSQNFTADIETGNVCSGSGCLECDGTALQNNTFKTIVGATLPAGNNSNSQGMENIYYCLAKVSDSISSQTYSTSGLGSWTLKVV